MSTEKQREYARNYYWRNRDKILDKVRGCPHRKEMKKKWDIENREYAYDRMKSYYSLRENWEKKILWRIRARARAKGLECNLEVGDIVIPEYCPYLGIKLNYMDGSGQSGSNLSVDRINSSLGYVKGNVEIMSHRANTMKSNASKEELVSFALEVLRRYQS